MTFQEQILEGIPNIYLQPKAMISSINHAPKRKDILSARRKKIST